MYIRPRTIVLYVDIISIVCRYGVRMRPGFV